MIELINRKALAIAAVAVIAVAFLTFGGHAALGDGQPGDILTRLYGGLSLGAGIMTYAMTDYFLKTKGPK